MLLNVEGNSITARKLSTLLNLLNLKELNLADNPIDSSALSVMLKVRTPMMIYMPSSFWNDRTIAPMEKRFGAKYLNFRAHVLEPD